MFCKKKKDFPYDLSMLYIDFYGQNINICLYIYLIKVLEDRFFSN